jgi:hypothetical protein
LANKYTTYVVRGTLSWAKVLGAPIMNDYAKERQWSVDLVPNEEGLKLLKKLGLSNKLKDKNDGRGKFISFRQSEFKKDGTPNDAIVVTDVQGNPWPANKLIGNGSRGDIKFSYVDFGTTKGNYIKAIRIGLHVPYVTQEFAPLSEDDEFFAQASTDAAAPEEAADTPDETPDNPDDLDDDVPF